MLYRDNNWQRFEATIRDSRGVIDGTGHASAIQSPTATAASTTPRGRSTTTPVSLARPTSPHPLAWRIDPIGERTCE